VGLNNGDSSTCVLALLLAGSQLHRLGFLFSLPYNWLTSKLVPLITPSIYLSIYLSVCLSVRPSVRPCCSDLEHRVSVKRFVSLQFINPVHSRYDSLDGGSARLKAAAQHKQNKRRQTSMPQVGFEPPSQCSTRRRQFMPYVLPVLITRSTVTKVPGQTSWLQKTARSMFGCPSARRQTIRWERSPWGLRVPGVACRVLQALEVVLQLIQLHASAFISSRI
jgi:hypothetical protein